MAGRVEQRIDDKFYLVVDEVGASSGIESEADSPDVSSFKNSNGDAINKEKSNINGSASEQTDTVKELNMCNSTVKDPGDRAENGKNECKSNDIVSNDSSENDVTDDIVSSKIDNLDSEVKDHQNSQSIPMDIESDSDESEEGRIKEMVPIIKISFRNEEAERNYKPSLLKFLAQKIHPCTIVMNSENNLELEIYEEEMENVLKDDVLDFDLDTTPSYNLHSGKVPSYGKNNDVLLSNLSSVQAKDTDKKKTSSVCFNCSGNHLLRNCPQKRNMKKIMCNKEKFHPPSKIQKNSRYHLDENQKFGHLIPGELSKRLRHALDLKKDQQPLFIYRMRLFGYPPAWLEEARVSHSGVAIYDSNGQPVSEEDEGEEGEVVPETAKDRFDISKIIEFPGFNVPLPKYMKEEGQLHKCPEMLDDQSKENMIKELQPKAVQAYKKRSLTLNKYSSQDAPSPGNNERKRPFSPTIEEMEEKKRLLLLELNDEDANSEYKLSQNAREEMTDSEVSSDTLHNNTTNTRNLDFGTPVLKSISPYSKLPSREHFSVNVSEVINFENLPNSTGKYESMSSLILKIRDTVSRIQNE